MNNHRQTCDRCKQKILLSGDDIEDFLAQEYPGLFICRDCDLKIQGVKFFTLEDNIAGNKLGTCAKKVFDIYQFANMEGKL